MQSSCSIQGRWFLRWLGRRIAGASHNNDRSFNHVSLSVHCWWCNAKCHHGMHSIQRSPPWNSRRTPEVVQGSCSTESRSKGRWSCKKRMDGTIDASSGCDECDPIIMPWKHSFCPRLSTGLDMWFRGSPLLFGAGTSLQRAGKHSRVFSTKSQVPLRWLEVWNIHSKLKDWSQRASADWLAALWGLQEMGVRRS